MNGIGIAQRSRRRFLRWAGVSTLLGASAAFAYAWRFEPHWIEEVHRDLPIARLPAALTGRTLVQISDLHFGPVVDDDYLCKALERVSSLRPDILAITGDFVTCRGEEPIEQAVRGLRNLRPGRVATIAVLGNHDYGEDFSQAGVADRLSARLADLGINVVRNGISDVEGLQIVGLDDLWGPYFRPEQAFAQFDASRASLVLCHNPDAADRPVWTRYRGWILCGHTHGGQCTVPFLGTPMVPVNNRRYIRGQVDLSDGRKLYINRGLGYLARVRFCVRPEITVFTLTGTEESI
jgi:uncharacterized protein